MGDDVLPSCTQSSHPIGVNESEGVSVRRHDGTQQRFGPLAGLGAIFLRPRPDESLELVIWGYDKLGLRLAARLLPMLTGVGQPDFVIVRKECAWEGAAGVLAMGSFDNHWNLSEGSFVY